MGEQQGQALPQDYTALVVEGDGDALETITEHLSRSGFRVLDVTNGWEALALVRDTPVDVVILNHAMADADGCSLRERFLLEPELRNVPFVFILPEGKHEQQIRVVRNGVDECVAHPFDPMVLVARVEAVIERRRAFEEMVRVDPLTRLLNRPTIERQIEEELARVARYGRPASIALLDLDGLSKINDEFGQAMGDLVITSLGGIILSSIRKVDIAGRFRGAKFFLYLPETGGEGAHILLLRILDRFAKATDAITGMRITYSAGVAEAPKDGSSFQVLNQRLEKALSEAKARGRGSIVFWAAEEAAQE